MIRSEAIKAFCQECMSDDSPALCDVKDCNLYRFRTGREDRRIQGNRVTRGKAIHMFCKECVGSAVEATRCVTRSCVLHEYRTGSRDTSTASPKLS